MRAESGVAELDDVILRLEASFAAAELRPRGHLLRPHRERAKWALYRQPLPGAKWAPYRQPLPVPKWAPHRQPLAKPKWAPHRQPLAYAALRDRPLARRAL